MRDETTRCFRSHALDNPTELRYTATHEWVRREADGTLTVGITFHAQDALGELVYVELPDAGRTLKQGEACVVVESTKAASDVYAPVDGEVVEANGALADAPETVNAEPFGAGWLFRLRPSNPSQVDALLDAAQYTTGPGSE
jgi:glycine cleavage system H protein